MRVKFMALVAALLLTTALIPRTAYAAVDAKIEVATVDGAVGERVEIPITISDCEHMDSLQFRINYDASALKYCSLANGDVFEGEYLVSNPAEPGLIQIATISAYGLTAEGTVLTLSMEILKETGGAITITDALATGVDPDQEFLQSKAYLSITDGGATVGGGALPNPAVTPWIAETPEPTPSPEPTPTPVPTDTPILSETPAAEETPALEEASVGQGSGTVELLAAAGAALAVLIAALVLISRKQRH